MPLRISDRYGITFDHLVPADDDDPHTLCLTIYELEKEIPGWAGVDYVSEDVLFPVNLADYAGKRVLAVPQCCQTGTSVEDNFRINAHVDLRDGKPERFRSMLLKPGEVPKDFPNFKPGEVPKDFRNYFHEDAEDDSDAESNAGGDPKSKL